MSSPTSRKSKRTSTAGTPSRSARASQVASSSPAANRSAAGATPRARPPVPASSPLFMTQSTPSSRRSATAARPGLSSPVRPNFASSDNDGGSTPGARAPGQSSPVRYLSSSPTRARENQLRSDSSNPLNGSVSGARRSAGQPRVQRSDIHSDFHSGRRRMYVDENGLPVSEDASDGTFSNLNPNTSEADVMGGASTRIVWGTNISIRDTSAKFAEFLRGFQNKYRMWADGASDEETSVPASGGNDKKYMNMLKDMLNLGVTGFNLDLRDLKCYPSTIKIWYQVQAYPHELIPIFDAVVKDVMVEIAEAEMRVLQDQRRRGGQVRTNDSSSMPAVPSSEANGPEFSSNNIPDLIAEVENRLYKTKPFGLDKTINLRDLNPNDMDKMVSVKGLVIRATTVIPDMKKAFFKCHVCNQTMEVHLDRGKIAEPTSCPREVCGTTNSMQIIHNRCEFADKQVIKLQETPDSVPDGQTPHSVSLCAYEDLVDVCKAGDRVEVTGIFRSNPVRINPRQRTVKSLFKTYVDVLFIQKVDKRRMGIDTSTIEQELSEQVAGSVEQVRKVTEEEEQKIKETAARPDVYELLSRSLAPSIFEHEDVKKGLLLQLFGGTNKAFTKGGSPKYRGDINVLLCGDPSTAKSQLLQYVHKIAPRGVYTSGKGSSAVGLTAYVTRDPETRSLVLESGALVLSDGGICCIDEFDKMSESTRSVLHEVMEQQTISIAKAGIITTLNARSSILASANPIGSKYNPNLPVPQNIDLPPTLLSRFDLVYLVLDRVDEQNDRRLAKHLVGMYLDDKPEHGNELEIMPVEFLTAYISYARRMCQPKITQAASDELVKAYVEMRKLGEDARASERRITATTRQLESMIRLAEAHAKMRLSEEVLASDVQEAVRLIKSALKQAATDARTGLIDMSLLTEGTSASERRRRSDLKKAVLDLLEEMTGSGGATRYSDVYRRINEQSSEPIETAEFGEVVRALEQEGTISVSGDGPRRTLRKVGGRI